MGGDIVGPVLSPHQAVENWQGKIASIIQGVPPPQDFGNRSWWLVDVRDAAEAEIRLAESKTVRSGERFVLGSGDRVPMEQLWIQAMLLHPDWDCATSVTPMPGTKEVVPFNPGFFRVQMRNDKICRQVGIEFRSFADTFSATLDSLVSVGGIKPRMKK